MIADSNGVMLIKRRYRIIDIDKFDPVVGFGAVHRELDYGKEEAPDEDVLFSARHFYVLIWCVRSKKSYDPLVCVDPEIEIDIPLQ